MEGPLGERSKPWLFASCLAAVAGYVDAIGFLTTGDFFVSFMSGNSTQMAVSLREHPATAALGLGLIAAFVAGVMTGAAAGRAAKPYRATAILGLISLLLAGAAGLLVFGDRRWGTLLLAFAMGMENTVFAEDRGIALTYVTGTLVKLGKALAAVLFGGARWDFLPYLVLWLSLVAGAVVGAAVFAHLGVAAVWGAAGAVAALALLSPILDRPFGG
jgi:uncharacterized membrane protein YoaK (UPF0700 family)